MSQATFLQEESENIRDGYTSCACIGQSNKGLKSQSTPNNADPNRIGISAEITHTMAATMANDQERFITTFSVYDCTSVNCRSQDSIYHELCLGNNLP